MINFKELFDKAAVLAVAHTPVGGVSLPAYKAKLDNWLQHTGVRSWARGEFRIEHGMVPFSEDLVPLVHHPLVQERGDAVRYQLLGHRLLTFNRFTEHLELEAVVPACVRLRLADVPFGVPSALARDAGRVALEETWHAECAGGLTTDMAGVSGITPCRPRRPAFLHLLKVVKDALPQHQWPLADLAFTCVSETLITSTLTKVPNDIRVIPAIREVLREHAREEAKHHAIFGQVIGVMWEQLSPADRDLVGPLFAIFITAFLRPDILAELDGLEAAGFTSAEAKRIVEETHGSGNDQRMLWQAASPTVRFMRRQGLLDHAATREALERMDLTASQTDEAERDN